MELRTDADSETDPKDGSEVVEGGVDEGPAKKRLFIGGIPRSVNNRQIQDRFAAFPTLSVSHFPLIVFQLHDQFPFWLESGHRVYRTESLPGFRHLHCQSPT